MNIADDIQKLHQLREQGALSQDEFEVAKRRLLESPQNTNSVDQLEEIKAQNQIAQLDREWEIERKNYMIDGEHGHQYIPGETSSVIGGVVIVGFGIFWTCLALSITTNSPFAMAQMFPLFGVVFVLLGAGMSIHSYRTAGQYQEAHNRYKNRRKQLTDKQSTS